MDRRAFLKSSSAAAFGLGMSAEVLVQRVQAQAPTGATWDAGSVLHILPQVSDTRMLVKTSFNMPLISEPSLRIGDMTVRGRMSDTRGEHWQFHASGLRPGQRYMLSLTAGSGAALCEPWELST